MIALDTSESVAGHTLQELKEGVSAAAARAPASDRAALIAFSSDVRLTHRTGEMTPRPCRDALSQAQRRLARTSLWDATLSPP